MILVLSLGFSVLLQLGFCFVCFVLVCGWVFPCAVLLPGFLGDVVLGFVFWNFL